MKEFTFFGRPFYFLTEERQWVKLQEYLNKYLFSSEWAKIAILLMLAVLFGVLLSLALRGIPKKICNHLSFFCYIAAMILLFIVSRETVRGIRLFNIDEYLTANGFHETRILIAVINCLMFVPFGVLLRKVSGKGRSISNVFLVVIMALGIEVAQYVFSKGYTALEDVLVYVVGGFAGLILAAPFCLISEYLEDRRKEKLYGRHSGDRIRRDRYRYDDYE